LRRRRLERVEIQLPYELLFKMDAVIRKLGFTGRSEFIRFLIHSFLLDLNRSGQNTANLRNNHYKHFNPKSKAEGK